MSRKINLSLVLGMLLGAAIFFTAKPVKALTITPLRFELNANPGDSVSGKLKFFNEENKPVTYYFVSYNFEAKDETGQPQFVSAANNLAKWINKPGNVTLEARSYQMVDFSITIPKDAEPGGYFAGLFASTMPEKEQAQNIVLTEEIGTLILFRVNGDIPEGANILEFDLKGKNIFYSSLPVDFYYRFKNSGADRIKPLGDIIITNFFGSVSKIIKANSDGGNILPQSIRRFEAAWLEPAGSGGVEQDPNIVRPQKPQNGFWKKVRYEWENFSFGRYSAKLNIVYGYNTQTSVTAKTSFWVFPWRFLLVAAASIIIFLSLLLSAAVWIVYKIIKRLGKRK